MSEKITEVYWDYIKRIRSFNDEIDLTNITNKSSPKLKSDISNDPIYLALLGLSEALSISYLQVKIDLGNENRMSWAGTAHEIREIVSHLLRILAPDEEIKAQAWYKKENDTNGPSQKQRVKLILQKQSAGSKQREVIEVVASMENLIGDLVRATYSRASDAAHRLKGKKEADRLLRYFEAFAHDLLDL